MGVERAARDLKTIPREADWAVTPIDPHDTLLGQWVSRPAGALIRMQEPRLLLFGLPFDAAVLGRKGSRGGPQAIRVAARTLKLPPGLDAIKGAARDIGDVVLPNSVELAHRHAESFVHKTLLMAGHYRKGPLRCRSVAFGGDHSLAYPCIKPYLDHLGSDLAVINLDAHLDIRQVEKGKPPNSGTGFGRLLEAGLKSYTVIGVRPFQTSAAYLRRARNYRARLISAEDVFEQGAVAVAKNVLKSLSRNCRFIYLSVDVDVADASVAPGCSAPTPGGLLAHQVFQLVRFICADRRTRACGIFEFAPNLEEKNSDRTARFAAGCLAEML